MIQARSRAASGTPEPRRFGRDGEIEPGPREFTPAESRLRGLLRILAALFLGATLIYFVGPWLPPTRDFWHHSPFVANSVAKVALLGMVAMFAAGRLRRRFWLVPVLIGGHLVSIGAMILVLATGAATDAPVRLFFKTFPSGQVLLWAIYLDGAITALLLLFYAMARRQALDNAPPKDPPAELGKAERALRSLLWILSVAFAVETLGYVVGALHGGSGFFRELTFVTNSAVKTSVLFFLCRGIRRDIRRELALVDIVMIGLAVSAITHVALVVSLPGQPFVLPGTRWNVQDFAWLEAIADAGIALLLFALYQRAWAERFQYRFLRQMEYRSLTGLADVILAGNQEIIPPEQIAANVDRYLDQMRARRRRVYRWALFALQLHPCLYMYPPLSEMDSQTRLAHLKRHFYGAVIVRLPEWWRRLVQVAIRIGKQLTYIGYYNDPATYSSVGFTPYSKRPGASPRPTAEHPLEVQAPDSWSRDDQEIEADVCIIGSGAGGAMLAYHLAERGRSVLILERGRYCQPREFTENEIEMVGALYSDGVFQQTEDFRFTILQGSCVGGSTTVNNAVCFAPPETVLDRWNDPLGQNAGLDLNALQQSVQYVQDFLPVRPQDKAPLNPSGIKFTDGIRLGAPGSEALVSDAVRANIKGCLGCGYCNIGCAFGKKLSMLDTTLPWAQARFPGRVRIFSECEVRRLRQVSGKPNRILDARGYLPDGRRITVRANTFILSAGTIASSYLLQRSGVGRDLPVGRHVSFNMGAPLTAEFSEPVDAFAGLQISHFGLPGPERGFALETWWNPPATQSVNLPGWFEDHYQNMRRFRHLMAVGVLVGTEATGEVGAALTGGPGVRYAPSREDLRKLADGLALTGEILFTAGATRLMANTWGYDVFTQRNQLAELYRIVEDPGYLALGTGHPQGGNAISVDRYRGVVDPEFRVHGYENLYICDASVFPSSTTVNPQLTVMSLAHYASKRIN